MRRSTLLEVGGFLLAMDFFRGIVGIAPAPHVTLGAE